MYYSSSERNSSGDEDQHRFAEELKISGINQNIRNIKHLVEPSQYLKKEYTNQVNPFLTQTYHQIANSLHLHFPRMRLIRGDGNCYYRAIILGYLELVISEGHLHKFIQKLRHGDQNFFTLSS